MKTDSILCEWKVIESGITIENIVNRYNLPRSKEFIEWLKDTANKSTWMHNPVEYIDSIAGAWLALQPRNREMELRMKSIDFAVSNIHKRFMTYITQEKPAKEILDQTAQDTGLDPYFENVDATIDSMLPEFERLIRSRHYDYENGQVRDELMAYITKCYEQLGVPVTVQPENIWYTTCRMLTDHTNQWSPEHVVQMFRKTLDNAAGNIILKKSSSNTGVSTEF